MHKSHRCDPEPRPLTFECADISVLALSEARHAAPLMRSDAWVTKAASFGQIWSRETLKLERILLWTQCSHSETFHRLSWTWHNGRIKARLHKFPPINIIFCRGTVEEWKERRRFLALFLIGLKLSGRNCKTINCFFIRAAQSEGSAVARQRCQPQSFPHFPQPLFISFFN